MQNLRIFFHKENLIKLALIIFIICLIILMADNSETIKKDFKTRTLGDKAYLANDAGSLQSQAIANDWTEFDYSYFSYNSANRIDVSTIDPTTIFQIGDKIRLKQTSYKYFYITRVQSNYINVRAGTDYTVANASITEFAVSRIINPAGFPTVFNMVSGIIAKDDDGDNLSMGIMSLKYRMIGNLLIVTPNLNFDVNADTTTLVQFSVPFAEATNKTTVLGGANAINIVNPGASDHLVYDIKNAWEYTGGINDYIGLSRVDTVDIAGLTAFGFRNAFMLEVAN